ncbi:substrate-binding domain-containing protein [Novosphingobium sp. MW5]|nr:substrate-binding domain-containing protein [Novosphingobium sp. MW5]
MTGFDDILLANLVVPRLTTVRQPTDTLARRAVELLFSQSSDIEDEMIDGSLIKRVSTGPAPQ